MKQNFYYAQSIKSLGHTPIYKTHKYFARRPHNVFRELLLHYTDENSVIFDPFGGGGVTLVEGLTTNRRVITSDVNPIASFIQYCQVLEVKVSRFIELAGILNEFVINELGNYYTTDCQHCESDAHVRWFEHAYNVKCPCCGQTTDLKNESKAKGANDKPKNGFYICHHCNNQFRAVDAIRISSSILNLRYKCQECGAHENKEPSPSDINKFHIIESQFEKILRDLEISVPDDLIPEEWDRQQEDCLHRKGFKKFTDLFTKRNLLACGLYFSKLDTIKNDITSDEYNTLLFLLSSLVRYINNMNFSTSSWMDGRPVAWAKHAYWTPNQFIEANPIEYFGNRVKAFKSGLKDRDSRFKGKSYSKDFTDVLNGASDYSVINQDSALVALPNDSVDMVLTDPPYGSNVQYGELCKFWQVWLEGRSPFSSEAEKFLAEAVVHRKTKHQKYSKDFTDYYQLLNKVFNNSYRVLKPNGVMVFTFNNKDIRAWYSVVKAAIDAGFYIQPEGIFYQEGIEAYRDTAHLRYDGTPQGDFIYTFVKYDKAIDFDGVSDSFDECLELTFSHFKSRSCQFSIGEFYVELFSYSTLCLIKQIIEGKDESYIREEFSNKRILDYLTNHIAIKQTGSKFEFSGSNS
ncbi:DNA methyltransferase [Thalassotalea montiporae]